MHDPSSVPETVIPSSGCSASGPEPTNVAGSVFVLTEPMTIRALIEPADTHGGTTTVSDVSASPRTILPLADPKKGVFPDVARLKNRPRKRTVSPAENDAGTISSSRGGGVAGA